MSIYGTCFFLYIGVLVERVANQKTLDIISLGRQLSMNGRLNFATVIMLVWDAASILYFVELKTIISTLSLLSLELLFLNARICVFSESERETPGHI